MLWKVIKGLPKKHNFRDHFNLHVGAGGEFEIAKNDVIKFGRMVYHVKELLFEENLKEPFSLEIDDSPPEDQAENSN